MLMKQSFLLREMAAHFQVGFVSQQVVSSHYYVCTTLCSRIFSLLCFLSLPVIYIPCPQILFIMSPSTKLHLLTLFSPQILHQYSVLFSAFDTPVFPFARCPVARCLHVHTSLLYRGFPFSCLCQCLCAFLHYPILIFTVRDVRSRQEKEQDYYTETRNPKREMAFKTSVILDNHL